MLLSSARVTIDAVLTPAAPYIQRRAAAGTAWHDFYVEAEIFTHRTPAGVP